MSATRFAPSPNGSLHLGHAYSAIRAYDLAQAGSRHALLRIEDIDGPRSKPELAEEFRADLAWLGLSFEEVTPQSQRLDSYGAAADRLRDMGLLYPCDCSRSTIAKHAVTKGPEGFVYPGLCKNQNAQTVLARSPGAAWRLDVAKAIETTGPLHWRDMMRGPQITRTDELGDVVLVRKGLPASYHLAATLDDAADGVTLVTRGWDLFEATHIHRLLQELLGLPVPRWHHHALLLDESGKKLAKRRHSPSLKHRREAGEDGKELAERLRRCDFPAGISLVRP